MLSQQKRKNLCVIGTYKLKLSIFHTNNNHNHQVYHEFDSAILSCILAIELRKLLARVVCMCRHHLLKFVSISDGGNNICIILKVHAIICRGTVLKTIGALSSQHYGLSHKLFKIEILYTKKLIKGYARLVSGELLY